MSLACSAGVRTVIIGLSLPSCPPVGRQYHHFQQLNLLGSVLLSNRVALREHERLHAGAVS